MTDSARGVKVVDIQKYKFQNGGFDESHKKGWLGSPSPPSQTKFPELSSGSIPRPHATESPGRCAMSGLLVGKLLHKDIDDLVMKMILLALAERCQKDNPECWPGAQWIASVTQRSLRTVRRVLAKAEKLGYVKKLQPSSPGTPVRWRLDFDEMPDLILTERRPQVTSVDPERRPSEASTAAISGMNGGQTAHRNNEEPVLNRKEPKNLLSEQKTLAEGTIADAPEKTILIEGKIPPGERKSGTDPRYTRFVELIFRAHKYFVKVEPIFNPAAGKHLKQLLADWPKLDEPKFISLLKNYHNSEDHTPAQSPHIYIPRRLPNTIMVGVNGRPVDFERKPGGKYVATARLMGDEHLATPEHLHLAHGQIRVEHFTREPALMGSDCNIRTVHCDQNCSAKSNASCVICLACRCRIEWESSKK
jgi:hypothetical protein